MQLEKIVKGIKTLRRNFLIGSALIGSLYFGGCDHTITGNVTVKKENVGEIIGRVLYDPYGEGYIGAEEAPIWRKGPDNTPREEKTVSITGGAFSYQEVPVGSHELRVYYPAHGELYLGHEGVSVTKGSVVNVDILLWKFEYPDEH